MKEDIGDDSHGDSFRDGVHEGHGEDGDVGRNRFQRIQPGDLDDLLHHQITDYDQGRRCCEGRDGQKQRGEEEGQDEEEAGRDSCQAGASALSDSGRGLDEGRDRRGTQAGAHGSSDRICQQSAADVGELAVLVQHICFGSASDQGSQCVKKVNKQESRYNGEEVQTDQIGEVQLHESRCQRGRCRENTAGDQAVETRFGIRNIQAAELAEDTQDPCDNNTDQDIAGYLFDDKPGADDHSDQCQQDRDTFILECAGFDGITERENCDQGRAVDDDMGVLQAYEADEETDTDCYAHLQGRRNRIEDSLTDICQ